MSKQKVWFVTGASKGIGFEITKAILLSGDKVVATVRSKAALLSDALDRHQNLEVVLLDVTAEEQVIQGVSRAIDKFGRIDVLVNNAGYGLLAATEEASDSEVRKQYDTNVFGLLNVIRAVLPYMRSQKSGHIINISSLFGYGASTPGFGLYGSTKYAVEGISEGLALELKPLGIHVTAAAPGLFRTEFASSESYASSKKILPDYEATVGYVRGIINQFNGTQPGDPAKLAGLIIKLANSKNPPLHLPVGPDAVEALKKNFRKIELEVADWEELSNRTDHLKHETLSANN
ncbi:MAG TPA: oxidoreductase [Flavitalea sp.]|nr:oxidoreductase [Flavitalea sp.]